MQTNDSFGLVSFLRAGLYNYYSNTLFNMLTMCLCNKSES